ncbi:MAG: hypothetical protein JNJ99_08005, partial [Crocinitomicaceae bacterium]|nr:hypothetical protein [Crocinitomicaceae bacterium]
MKHYLHIVLIFILVLAGCAGKPDEKIISEQDDTTGNINYALDSLITGTPLPCNPVFLSGDSLPDPIVFKALPPFIDSANKNVHRINPPEIKLVGSNLPHLIPGRDSLENPVSKKATGKISLSRYSEPVAALAPNFKDAASYNLQYIDVDQGLSSSYVMNILEDSRGNLWFANWTAGVSVYDGKSFVHFKELNGFMSNYIWTIHEDQNGNMWFGSDGLGVCKYDGSTFTEYSVSDGLASNLILDIDEDAEGNLWFA